jgi:hypothetical protein
MTFLGFSKSFKTRRSTTFLSSIYICFCPSLTFFGNSNSLCSLVEIFLWSQYLETWNGCIQNKVNGKSPYDSHLTSGGQFGWSEAFWWMQSWRGIYAVALETKLISRKPINQWPWHENAERHVNPWTIIERSCRWMRYQWTEIPNRDWKANGNSERLSVTEWKVSEGQNNVWLSFRTEVLSWISRIWRII